jgi:ElaB/YqjD/DUF883 family membrane-anchored ribosome-binding protein
MYSKSEIRDVVSDIAGNAAKIFSRVEDNAVDTIHHLGKRFHKLYPVWEKKFYKTYPVVEKKFNAAYPIVVDNLRDGSDKALKFAKHSGKLAKYKAADISVRIGRDLRFMESVLIHVGLGYLALKIYKACDNGPESPAQRVKAHIHRKPAESALIALGVGLVLGKLFS